MDPATFLNSPSLKQFFEFVNEGQNLVVEGLWNSPKALLAFLASLSKKNVLLITSGQEENHLFDDMTLFASDNVYDFPAWETLPSEEIAPSVDIVGERLKTLKAIGSNKGKSIIISPLQACLQKVVSKNDLLDTTFSLKVGENHSFEKLKNELQKMGYTKVLLVTDKGQFASRGGILDVYPISSPEPFRVEFFGSTIESIRAFDPASQKSVKKVESFELLPANEISDTVVTLLDYLGKDTILFFDDLLALEDQYLALRSLPGAISKSFMSLEEFLQNCQGHQKCFLTKENIETLSDISRGKDASITFSTFNQTFTAKRFKNPFVKIGDLLFDEDEEFKFQHLSKFSGIDLDLIVVSQSLNDERSFKRRVEEDRMILPEKTSFILGTLSSGFILKDSHLALLPLSELTKRSFVRRPKQRTAYHVEPTSELLNLSTHDLVVHFNYGIGKFLGIEKKPNHLGVMSEFLLIEYAEKSKLYVPFSQSYLLTKYVGSSEELPTLHDLNSNRWKQLRTKTEGAILGYAKELLTLYAKRTHNLGFPCPEDSLDMLSFESDFPYTETEDQKEAIVKVKEDMMSSKCMDRLVCGDVGFGKTEVAMRAAFKAVVDGKKQVAVLVPTTVLAMQHYENFQERMRNFPIRVGQLSRFCTKKEIQKTLEEVENGSVDILIGTHRLISKDVLFKDLGLVIIDEEQRFGVKVKEHLKTLTTEVDCLTLSATPIPRTLYMSLVGARDMSVIATPPQDRLPIKTILSHIDEQVIQTALKRELARGGQAYVIHNKVETIFDMLERIKKLVPEAKVLVVHGQMSSSEIDLIFHTFKHGGADILIATTIIESGVDIPNANTILIDRADHFGLADLYQLRGRVGRWNRRAYCYFLTPKNRTLPEIARKRLSALSETSGFGGGMRIAMRDLEIRGAGDLLGVEQSGHVATVGFHLYCKLLKRTIDALQGKGLHTRIDTKIDFPQDARIPEDYVDAAALRLEIYQRIGDANSQEELDALFDELKDRFGTPPLPTLWLRTISKLRLFASQNNYTLLKLQNVTLHTERKVEGKVITKTIPLTISKDPKLFLEKLLSLLQ